MPLALENIAALISWPGEELTEGQFLAELVERTGVRLLIDVANLHTNHVNRGEDPAKALDELPVEAIAYVHVAGGVEKDGVWHDTHAHPVTRPVLDVLAELRSRIAPPGVLLERDDDFPPAEELAGELTAVRATLEAAGKARSGSTSETGASGHGGIAPAASPVESADDTTTAATSTRVTDTGVATDGARDRAAVAQTALLSALVVSTPAPRASTTVAWASRAVPWPPSGPTSSPRWRPSCPGSSATATGTPSSRTPGPAPCPPDTGATHWTSPSSC